MFGTRALIYIALLVTFERSPLNAQDKAIEKLGPYYPTPQSIVAMMLELGGLKPGETMFDAGSGDGRIVIMAAAKFKAFAVGVEFDNDLWISSGNRLIVLGLSGTAHIIHGDLLAQDYSTADLVTVYLHPEGTSKLQPILDRQLKKGSRVVAHDYPFSAWRATKLVKLNDEEGRAHRLFLYRR